MGLAEEFLRLVPDAPYKVDPRRPNTLVFQPDVSGGTPLIDVNTRRWWQTSHVQRCDRPALTPVPAERCWVCSNDNWRCMSHPKSGDPGYVWGEPWVVDGQFKGWVSERFSYTSLMMAGVFLVEPEERG